MVTLCPSEVPERQRWLRACSGRPRDVEDKIAGDGLAERFSLLADVPVPAQNDRRHEARSGRVLAGMEDAMARQTGPELDSKGRPRNDYWHVNGWLCVCPHVHGDYTGQISQSCPVHGHGGQREGTRPS